MSGKHDRASELRAIADGRLLLHVRNGVTVSLAYCGRGRPPRPEAAMEARK